MKRVLIRFGGAIGALVLGLVAVSSCATGSSAPPPTNRMARLGRVEIDTLNTGYRVYQSHCIRCHQAGVPKAVPGRPWHPESMGLSLYSSLSAAERYGVIEYLKAVQKSSLKMDFGSLQDTSI